jgi:FSR family fosmidomycin resistance protein-like MFS transporter
VSQSAEALPGSVAPRAVSQTAFGILVAISVSHMLNDLMQSLIPAIYPILKQQFALDFGQIGIIQLAFQLTASILQPVVGIYTDRHGLAQSLFQVGGNVGSAIGPLLAAFIVLSRGQSSIAWFSIIALAGMLILGRVGFWYRDQLAIKTTRKSGTANAVVLPRAAVYRSIAILAALIFSKFFYMASMSSYFTFYLIETFHVSVQSAQLHLFIFLGAVAVGTIAGGPFGDRFGRKFVIWLSILGVLPFTLLLPHADLFWTTVLSVIIGLVLSSAFPAIIVYAQELVPGKVGLISGLFFGFAFGMGGIGAAALGELADFTSITFVYQLCAFLPLIGLLTAFLPNIGENSRR